MARTVLLRMPASKSDWVASTPHSHGRASCMACPSRLLSISRNRMDISLLGCCLHASSDTRTSIPTKTAPSPTGQRGGMSFARLVGYNMLRRTARGERATLASRLIPDRESGGDPTPLRPARMTSCCLSSNCQASYKGPMVASNLPRLNSQSLHFFPPTLQIAVPL